MADRLLTTEPLRVGDIVQVAVELTDKVTGAPFWWRRFAAVMRKPRNRQFVEVLTLKLKPDMVKDLREIDLAKDVVTKLDVIPQGVAAMHVKLLALRVIPVPDD